MRSGTVTGCGDNYEFGQKQSRCFFKKLEKGNDARTAVNLHNNEVGREVNMVTGNSACQFRFSGRLELSFDEYLFPTLENRTLVLRSCKEKNSRLHFEDGLRNVKGGSMEFSRGIEGRIRGERLRVHTLSPTRCCKCLKCSRNASFNNLFLQKVPV